MTIDEAEITFKNAIQKLAESQLADCQLTTLDMIGFIKLRLAEGGGNADGGQFTDYSTVYGKVRQAKGLQVNFKDFNVSGRLYASIRPNVKSATFGRVEIDIVPSGADNELKVAGQFKREGGNILYPSPQEIQDATDAHTKRRLEAAQKLFE